MARRLSRRVQEARRRSQNEGSGSRRCGVDAKECRTIRQVFLFPSHKSQTGSLTGLSVFTRLGGPMSSLRGVLMCLSSLCCMNMYFDEIGIISVETEFVEEVCSTSSPSACTVTILQSRQRALKSRSRHEVRPQPSQVKTFPHASPGCFESVAAWLLFRCLLRKVVATTFSGLIHRRTALCFQWLSRKTTALVDFGTRCNTLAGLIFLEADVSLL